MNTNRATLAQLREMSMQEVNLLPIDQLAALLEEMAVQETTLAWLADKINQSLAYRYQERAAELRRAEGKDTGMVSIPEGDYVVRADLPKKVEWDQDALNGAMLTIQTQWKEDPADYLNIKLTVPEARFNAWPQAVRAMFEGARTVSTGKPSYKLEPAKRRAL
ncbi:MAG: hypothetical protein ING08_08075 [Roseomonas sp.]|nr:hypothetical protein [Roseomonas sp.]